MQLILAVLSIVATLASSTSIFVTLYVKGAIGPIISDLKNQGDDLAEHRGAISKLWERVTSHGERLARLEPHGTRRSGHGESN